MANNNKLKAYVRFDGSGRVIPGSLILQRNEPKVGKWRQINSKECCLNNECRAAVYGQDWILDDIQEVEGGLVFYLLTNPFENFNMQVQLVNCETGKGFGEIITVGTLTGFEYNWFVPLSTLELSCGFQVRNVCNTDLNSGWSFWD